MQSSRDDPLAVLWYDRTDERLRLLRIVVPAPLASRGIGSELVREGASYAQAQGLPVMQWYAFACTYFCQHPAEIAAVDPEYGWPVD